MGRSEGLPTSLGDKEGVRLGQLEGLADGMLDGAILGQTDGSIDREELSGNVGIDVVDETDGIWVGRAVGSLVGMGDGDWVT